jgi:predicted acyl esterase
MRGIVGIGVSLVVSLVFASSASAFDARGSVEQVWATGLTPGAAVTLKDSGGDTVETKTANDHGGTLFRNVAPGGGYTVNSGAETSPGLIVMGQDPAPPSTDFYDQEVKPDGYGYMTMRDGVKLSYATHPPSDISSILASSGVDVPAILEPLFQLIPSELNQSPTLIEYSGYGTADPDGPESGISILANLMGYTVVDVNMRGTGCSGGAYDFFEPLQGLDGYDVIETVARQPWVKGDKVGMFGISFGGISQLFTAQYQPPSLAAITPLSVIDQTQTTLYPGGVLNTGFAYSWAVDRVHDARPAPDGQPWANDQIADELAETPGSSVCRDNQALHPEAADLLQKIDENDHYVPEVADPLSPKTFVHKINAPTFLACQWTDEQTGGHCPTLADRLTGTDVKRITFTNGTHVDSLAPETMNELFQFLEIYVNETAPSPLKVGVLQGASPLVFQEVFGIEGMQGRFDSGTAVTHAQAKADFEAQDPIRILFDNGAGSANPGHPYPGFERGYESYPPPSDGRSWYFGDEGTLTDSATAEPAADGFTSNGANGAATYFTGNTGTGGLWGATPDYQWNQDPAGTAVAYATEPLDADTTVLGSGAVDVWVRSSKPNVDLEVTISEIRPDGKETFVQGGWMRGDARALDAAKSTELEPVLSLREADAQPLPADQFVKATIPLYYEGHVYRAGSQIRVRISAPGADAPVWSFAEIPNQTAEVAIGHGGEMPSRLLLPVVDDPAAPTALPPCPGLRGQPCRDHDESFENEPAPLTVGSGDPGTPATGGSNDTPSSAKKCKKAKKRKGKKRKKKPRCKKKKKKKRR